MKLAICSLLVFALLMQGDAYKFDSKKLDKKVEESANHDDKRSDKRGATVEIQASESAYITPSPAVHVSHGPTIIPAVSVTPGIIYAQQKEVGASASPSQIYAKPSPHLAKVVEDVLAPAPINNLVVNPLHQHQVYQTVPKVAYNAPTFAITSPVAAHLAYSKHQIVPQQLQQVQYAAYSQPQVYHAQPQIYHTQPQIYHAQPQIYHAQQQLYHAQPQVYQAQQQVYHAQPQVYHTQPQVYHAQPQAYHSQPQVYHAQPQVYHSQHVPYVQPQHVQVYQHQPLAYHQSQAYSPVVVAQPVAKVAYAQPQVYHGQQVKNDAISYTSFAQSELSGVHYPNPLKVIPAPSLVSQAPVIAKQSYQPHYYHQPQQVQYQTYQQLPALTQKVAYSQPQSSAYSSSQVFGKNGQNTQNSYNSYNH